jgi:Uma2 family endonuclease
MVPAVRGTRSAGRPDTDELAVAVDHLITEDDTPLDRFYCEKQLRLLSEPLYSSRADWAGERSFVAAANVGLFFVNRNPAIVPDGLLSMDVELPADLQPKCNRSYFVWRYGKPPDVVIEMVSNDEGGEQRKKGEGEKLAAYARGRVPYYVIFDLDRFLGAEVLRGYRLDPTSYRRTDEPIDFPEFGVGLRLWQGRYEGCDTTWLRWVDARGVPIATGQERAEAERQRAEAERQRAERLAEQLRQLGVEPRDH